MMGDAWLEDDAMVADLAGLWEVPDGSGRVVSDLDTEEEMFTALKGRGVEDERAKLIAQKVIKVRGVRAPPPPPPPPSTIPEGTAERLYELAYNGEIEEIKAFCSEWAGNEEALNYVDPPDGWFPLWMACREERHDVLEVLVNTPGVDLNKVCNCGSAVLENAASRGHIGCLRIMLAAKEKGLDVDLNKKGYRDLTPLEAALENNQTEAVQMLEQAGALPPAPTPPPAPPAPAPAATAQEPQCCVLC